MAPGHSFFFGHLLYLKSMLDRLPRNAHYQYALGDVTREHFSEEGVYYIDLWPVSGLFLTVVSPSVANQIHANPEISMESPSLLPRFFKPICGGPSMFDMCEKDWKPWRAIFSKSFSADHVLSLVPGMVDETLVYCETLRSLAVKKNMFYVDLTTLRFTIDVIGKTILCVVSDLSIVRPNLIYEQERTSGSSIELQHLGGLYDESDPVASSQRGNKPSAVPEPCTLGRPLVERSTDGQIHWR